MQKNDRTTELFDWLEVTPETHPWAHKKISGVLPFTYDYLQYELLSNTLEADGLATLLYEIASVGRLINITWTPQEKAGRAYGVKCDSFARAVHDALCEAMDAEKGEKYV